MAELVEFNLEQHLQFFNSLKNHINDEKLNELVSKRRHFEYKICSRNREFNSFKFYVQHELQVLSFLDTLQIPDINLLIKLQKNLIERLVKQITIHFQSEPRAFILAISIMKKIKRTTSEKFYWEELLTKHGSKNPKFYVAAGISTMHDILKTVNDKDHHITGSKLRKLEEKLAGVKATNNIKSIKKFEKEKETLVTELNKSKQVNFVDSMQWTRFQFVNGFNEHSKNMLLFKEYLKFEILNMDFFLTITEDIVEGSVAIRNGLLIEYLLKKSLETFVNTDNFQEIVDVMFEFAPTFESAALEKIVERISNASQENISMEHGSAPEPMEVNIDIFEVFTQKYPDLKMVRTKSPMIVEKELHIYLQALKVKMINNQILNRTEEMVKIRKSIDWILNDDEWASTALDLWWDYYELERSCGDIMKACMVYQNADRKLKWEFKQKFILRKLKHDKLNDQ